MDGSQGPLREARSDPATRPETPRLIFGRVPTSVAIAATFDSRLRQEILTIVNDSPGIRLTELMERMSVGWGTLYHHLGKLREAGLIQTQVAGRRRLVYPIHRAAAFDSSAQSLLCGRTARLVALSIQRAPHRSLIEICDELGLSPRSTYYHVRRLLDAGLITSGSTTRHFDLCATPALTRLLEGESSRPPFRVGPTTKE